jgi:hypothetical protein
MVSTRNEFADYVVDHGVWASDADPFMGRCCVRRQSRKREA